MNGIGAGDLRTKITVFDLPRDRALDADGYPTAIAVNVFGDGGSRQCRWVNAHGREVFTARQAGLNETATLTLRYTSKITTTCTIYRDGDVMPYEVISLNDWENRHAWLEIKVQRKVQQSDSE